MEPLRSGPRTRTVSGRDDFTHTNTGTYTEDNISRALGSLEEAKNFSESDKSSDHYIPKSQDELQNEINWLLGPLQVQIQKLQQTAKRKASSKLDKALSLELARVKTIGAQLMFDKITMVHSEEYLEHKQALLNELAAESGERPRKARIETFEFL